MKIGIVGYQGSGKSSVFRWLTGVEPDLAQKHGTQSAMAPIPDERVAGLCEIYKPKKITLASLELVDTPGLSRDHEGSAARLATIREAGALVVVVDAYSGGDPAADAINFEEDFLLADLDIVSKRVEKLEDELRRPRPNREEREKELAALKPIYEALDAGRQVYDLQLSEEQEKSIRSFQLLTRKPRMIFFNAADDDPQPGRFAEKLPEGTRSVAVSLALENDLAQMAPEERAAFCEEMGVAPASRDEIIRQIMDLSGQMLFFTAGEKEVRTWLIPKNSTAQEAAGSIHTDMYKGFIRAEIMTVADLVRLGSEREVKAAGLARNEQKGYVVQDGDVLNIRHN